MVTDQQFAGLAARLDELTAKVANVPTTLSDHMALAQERVDQLNSQLDEHPEQIDDVERQLKAYAAEHGSKAWTLVGLYSQVGLRINEMRKRRN